MLEMMIISESGLLISDFSVAVLFNASPALIVAG
jgi:hypothetical protein